MSDDLNNAVKQNTADIKDLAKDMKEMSQAVTRVATLVEGSEKRHLEDKETMRQVFERINDLASKVAAGAGTDEKVAALLREFLELKTDFRTLNHDCKTAFNTLQAMPIQAQKIMALETKVEALETWRDKIEGGAATAGAVVKGLWAVFGLGILALGGYLMKLFFGGGSNGGY